MSEDEGARSFVSARQVAERAGVSRSAVSRTFTEGASVSETVRQKVLSAAEELGYHVNHLARSLIREDSGIVGIIVAEIATPYQARMLDALSRGLQRIGRTAMLINTRGDTAGAEAALRQTLHYRATATIVLSGAPSASLVRTCTASGQHVILINRDDQLEGPVNVAVDNARAGREAFHMLHRAGCRQLALVSSTAGTPSLLARERAFEEAAHAAGLAVRTVRTGPTSYATGVAAGKVLLSGSDRPDAAFCVTDLLACGFMDAARFEFHVEIPRELCVVGFDDIEQSSWSSYALTTFRQPVDEIADHIMTVIEFGAGPRSLPAMIEAAPVWRNSVRPR